MNRELHDAWQRFRDDDDAFVLVITGGGETTFCAGWDLQDAAELTELGDYDAFRVSLHNSPGACGYTRKVDIFKPVIAAVNGHAFAAGLETALLADIRIAAGNAQFGAFGAAVEHRRRGRDDGAPATRRRVCDGNGADHYGPPNRRT
jgi:enoyl-CoA hydratase